MWVWYRYRAFYYVALILIPFMLMLGERMIKNQKVLKAIKWVCLISYASIIIYLTVVRRSPKLRRIKLQPFWSYELLHDMEYRLQIYLNIFLFLPLGFLVPYTTGKKLLKTMFFGFLLSTLIEVAQYIFGRGLCEFDDVFDNTVGTLIGYGYWRVLKRIVSLKSKKQNVEVYNKKNSINQECDNIK